MAKTEQASGETGTTSAEREDTAQIGQNASEHEALPEPAERKPRKPYAKRQPKADKRDALDLKSAGLKICALHEVAAIITRQPLFKIEEEEGVEMARACADVMKQYNIEIDPKTAAWLQLALVVSGIYLPKFAMILLSIRANKEKRRAEKVAEQIQKPTTENKSAASPFMGVSSLPVVEGVM